MPYVGDSHSVVDCVGEIRKLLKLRSYPCEYVSACLAYVEGPVNPLVGCTSMVTVDIGVSLA